MKWRQRLHHFVFVTHEKDKLDYLKEILASSSHESFNCPEECSEVFKFFSGVVKNRPESLALIVSWIVQNHPSAGNCESFYRGMISFLARMKRTVRRDAFEGQISRLWPLVFNRTGGDLQKVFLVREYRREVSFDWLLAYILNYNQQAISGGDSGSCGSTNFFYLEDLNASELKPGGGAVVDILLELLEKGRANESSALLELRVSGVLEKIGSLWRSQSLKSNVKILKLLALASSVSSANIFDSLPGLLDVLLEEFLACEQDDEEGRGVWVLRLAGSILKKFPKRQYILSAMRADLQTVSRQFVTLCGSALGRNEVAGVLKGVLERWDDLACDAEMEEGFVKRVSEYLEADYKRLLLKHKSDNDCKDQYYDDSISFKNNDSISFKHKESVSLIYIFCRNFIDPLSPLLPQLFRNAVKQAATSIDCTLHLEALKEVSRLLVLDGGTDRAFPLMFRDHPSLIDDIHRLIEEGQEGGDQLQGWLLILAESSRTRDPLIEFILDPEQVKTLKSDSFWLALLSRLLCKHDDQEAEAEDMDEKLKVIDSWLGQSIKSQFQLRFKAFDPKDRHQIHFFKLMIPKVRPEDVPVDSLLRVCRKSPVLLEWMLAVYTDISCCCCFSVADYLEHLEDFGPFDGSRATEILYERVKPVLKDPKELLECIFSVDGCDKSKSKSQFKVSCSCLSQWNLLVKSGNLRYSEDLGEALIKDYRGYLEELFSDFNGDGIEVLESASTTADLIETFINYYKYGDLRAMFSMQTMLLDRYTAQELVFRIPLVVLRSTGEFGLKILDDFLINGWDNNNNNNINDDEGEEVGLLLKEKNHIYNLKIYYQSRLK